MRCAAITRAGGRCRLEATHGSYCYQHSPETVEERRRNASRGGRAGGNGRAGVSELAEIKVGVRTVIQDVLSGQTERAIGAVAFQGYNTLLKAVETERRVKETEELEKRLAEIERRLGQAQERDQRKGA